MVNRPQQTNSFEFIAIATLRTGQLMRGCLPRVPPGHKSTTTAQLEIIAGKILRIPQAPLPPQPPDRHNDSPARLEPDAAKADTDPTQAGDHGI